MIPRKSVLGYEEIHGKSQSPTKYVASYEVIKSFFYLDKYKGPKLES
jgi:hypothetical protein